MDEYAPFSMNILKCNRTLVMDYNYAILNNGITVYIVSRNDEWISHCN